jgi:hypothetical protein
MKRVFAIAGIVFCVAAVFLFAWGTRLAVTHARSDSGVAEAAESRGCPNDDSGLKLPGGFCATVFADGIGHARHLVATPDGVLYVNTWSGRYYGNDTPHAGGFLVALKDSAGAGKADVAERFG